MVVLPLPSTSPGVVPLPLRRFWCSYPPPTLAPLQFEDDGDDHGQVKNEDVLKGAESNLGCASIINKCVASHRQLPTANRAGASA